MMCGRCVGISMDVRYRGWRVKVACVFAHLQVKSGTIFDNFLVTDDEEYAKQMAKDTWGATKDPEKKMKEKVGWEGGR